MDFWDDCQAVLKINDRYFDKIARVLKQVSSIYDLYRYVMNFACRFQQLSVILRNCNQHNFANL